ncbi:MAG: hypothetical protein AAF707_01600 [Pseudomonadota bacterium]
MKLGPQQWWNGLSIRAKAITSVIAVFTAIIGLASAAFTALDQYIDARVKRRVEEAPPLRCVRIPASGHSISTAYPGRWAVVTIVGIERLRSDCGHPLVRGNISNGDRVWHRALLGIEGVDLPVGRHNLSYPVYIDRKASPGSAVLEIKVTFPEARGGNQDPGDVEIPFIIKPRPEGMSVESPL